VQTITSSPTPPRKPQKVLREPIKRGQTSHNSAIKTSSLTFLTHQGKKKKKKKKKKKNL
jgi:hypothetical protein